MALTDTNGSGAGTGVITNVEAGDNWDDYVERLALESLTKRAEQMMAETNAEMARAQETLHAGRMATAAFDHFGDETPHAVGNRMRQPGYPYPMDRAPFIVPRRALPDFNPN